MGNINISILKKRINNIPLSEKEEADFIDWYESDSNHKIYFENLKKQQEKIIYGETSKIDVDKAYSGLIFKMNNRKKSLKYIYFISSVAASLILAISIFFILNNNQSTVNTYPLANNSQIERPNPSIILRMDNGEELQLKNDELIVIDENIRVEAGVLIHIFDSTEKKTLSWNEVIVPNAGEYQIILSDGTKVFLNSSTILKYPVNFSEKERKVYIEGEAYFIVQKSDVPFIVETSETEIKVLGTEFNVMTYKEEGTIETVLVKGSVGIKVENENNYTVLTPGQLLSVDRETKQKTLNVVDILPYTAWKDGLFISQNDNLDKIMRKVSRWFDMEVLYSNEQIKEKRFYGIMKKQTSLNEILEIITAAGNIEFNISGKTILISEK